MKNLAKHQSVAKTLQKIECPLSDLKLEHRLKRKTVAENFKILPKTTLESKLGRVFFIFSDNRTNRSLLCEADHLFEPRY